MTSTADSATPSSGMLRYEINQAVTGDVIVFSLTYPATITLNAGAGNLSVAGKNISIKGPGADALTVSGNNATRIFSLSSATLTLSEVTLANGRLTTLSNGAGASLASSTLTLDRCVVTGCALTYTLNQVYGAGVFVDGTSTLTALRSTFYNNQAAATATGQGGAIANLGTLTMVDSLCVSNTAYMGAAVFGSSSSPEILTNCTFTANFTDNQGVIFHRGNGNVTVTNCTITKNRATNVAASYESGLSMYDNIGLPAPTLTLNNSVIAGNTTADGTSDTDIYFDITGAYGTAVTFVSGNYNFIGNRGAQTYAWAGQDLVGTYASPLNANLANLAENGGYTASHLPNTGSSVINPVSSNGSTFEDGRGYLRVSTSERGATEYGGTAPTASAASALTSSGFTANWSAITGATGYLLDVATDAGFTAKVTGYWDLAVGNVTSYPVTGLSAGTTYYYRVRGTNGANQTFYTNAISAVPVADSPTCTPTLTATRTPTATPTSTRTQTATWTPTATSTGTITASPTTTPTPNMSSTTTPTRTRTSTSTQTATFTASATATPSATSSRTGTTTPTRTASQTATATGTLTPIFSPTATTSRTRTSTATATGTATPTPTLSRTPTQTPTRTGTPTGTVTATITPTATVTPQVSATTTWTPVPASTRTATAVATGTLTPGDQGIAAYPNPARRHATFLVRLDQPESALVQIFNLNGERVATLQVPAAGTRALRVPWDCPSMAPGLYLVRLVQNGKEIGKLKLAIIK